MTANEHGDSPGKQDAKPEVSMTVKRAKRIARESPLWVIDNTRKESKELYFCSGYLKRDCQVRPLIAKLIAALRFRLKNQNTPMPKGEVITVQELLSEATRLGFREKGGV